jgi:hypothetical protein
MEGHRHEKVAIVLCAYIIGFTTAFIGFGVSSIQKNEVQKESAKSETPVVVEDAASKIQKNIITSISFGDDGLYAVTPVGNILLSVNKSALEASVIGATRSSGYYFKIIDAEASRDGKFAYFCEQLMENDTTCDPYVYDLQGDILHKVSTNASVIQATISSHASSWDEDGRLTLNGKSSGGFEKPWELIEDEEQSGETSEPTSEVQTTSDLISEDAQVQ